MKAAFFDLDGTLLDGACEALWVELLAEEGRLDAAGFERFRADYRAGRLDVAAYNAWQNAPCEQLEPAHLLALRERLVHERVLPRIPAAARRLVAVERACADLLVLATAASDFLTEPIAAELGFDVLLATRLERRDGRPTATLVGEPCYREGKLRRALELLVARGGGAEALADASFHSDSLNDLPLLERVGRPVVVDPDALLEAHARARGWPVLWLHGRASAAGATG